MKARDFIKPDEKVIVVFTNGTLFERNPDNDTGLTGDWKINPKHSIDRVVIYLRGEQANMLYIANHAGVEFVEGKRYKIKLAQVQYIGETDSNWSQFAETKQNPIRYLSKSEP
jgi:hypothetical protein